MRATVRGWGSDADCKWFASVAEWLTRELSLHHPNAFATRAADAAVGFVIPNSHPATQL